MTRKAAMTEEVLRQMNVAYDETRDRLRQAEADRDAYAAVAKIAVACVYNPHFLIRKRLSTALYALTDEQKERIT